jgi:hypothetical protein
MTKEDRAKLYRERANELRRLAETFSGSDSRRELLGLADSWDAMADRIDGGQTVSSVETGGDESRRKAGS